MAKKHKKSSKKRKHKKSGKHRDRSSKSDKKHRKASRSKRKRSRSKEKKRRSKDRGKHDKGRRSKARSKSASHRSRRRHRKQPKDQHPDMTAAAMNENLGNIVLVKNRHKVQQQDNRGAVATAVEPSDSHGKYAPAAPAPQDSMGQMPQVDRSGTGIAAGPGPPSGSYPPRPEQQQYVPPRVNMVPLGGAEPVPSAPTTGTATTTPATSTTVTTTGATTTTGPTTTTPGIVEVPSSTGAPPPPQPIPPDHVPRFPSDEITRKEAEPADKAGCDKTEKWKTYVEKTLEGGSEGMANEFRGIRGYLPPMATRIAFDANTEKNRFEDIVCIDQTRVRLSCDSYIHASWVNISPNRKAILTQLPNRESGSDFWQMVLDVDAQAILLILTHAEYNMFHAAGVFPAEQDFVHYEGGHVRVGEFKRVVIDRDWTMHVISVKSGDRRKYVHMHHYSGWTHGKQPSRIQDLWQIQSVFRRYPNPHIYMSLSGCGRAGTYAAFEIAHDRLHSDSVSRLNINECVCRARNGRMHAVQRIIQMQTIHAAILEHIMGTKFAAQLSTKTVQRYEEFSERFNKCAELQEDMPG